MAPYKEYSLSSTMVFIAITAILLRPMESLPDQVPIVLQSPVALPECTKTTVITGEVTQEEVDTRKISIATNMRLNLGLKETACLYVQTQEKHQSIHANESNSNVSVPYSTYGTSFPYHNGSLLYVIQYVGLNQLHPIRQRYEFGIPYLESKCICDCPGGTDHCPVGYQYKNCTASTTKGDRSPDLDTVCVTTYFAHQPSTGCLQGPESELCCELWARPFENRRFTALYIGQPDAVAEFRYQLYTASPSPEAASSLYAASSTDSVSWTKTSEETFRVSLNRHQRLQLANDRLEIRVSGTKPFYQLKDGMYFYENLENTRTINLKDGVPINELHEYDLGRLGWFRRRNARWTIRNAWIRLQDAHKIQVKNCKEQTYTESFNAEYFVDSTAIGESESEMPILGHEVIEEEPWIQEIKVEIDESDRNGYGKPIGNPNRLIVNHKDSNPIEIDLTMDNQVKLLKLLHHSSSLSDFSGSIRADRLSNRYLNLTLIKAKGTLIGTVYNIGTSGRQADLAFSHYVDTSSTDDSQVYRVTIALPAQINGTRWICIHPLDRSRNEICKWILFEKVALDDKETPANGLIAQRGQCSDCNEMTVQNFLQYLNPAQWINGISGPTEALAMGLELLFYGALILLAIALCRRLVCPVVQWAACGDGSCFIISKSKKRVPSETL